LITYGVGIGLGSILSGKVVDAFTVNGVKDWGTIWLIPCALAAVIALFFALTFKDRAADKDTLEMEAAAKI
jgi:predicted MFS family arabinose efflux permease